jgi:putative addiction module component (TIGR02574 family)
MKPMSLSDSDEWLGGDDPLSDDEKALLEVRLAAYERESDAGSSWEEVETRTQSRFKALGGT